MGVEKSYRLGCSAVEVLAQASLLNVQSDTVRSYTPRIESVPEHRNPSCRNLCRPYCTQTLRSFVVKRMDVECRVCGVWRFGAVVERLLRGC